MIIGGQLIKRYNLMFATFLIALQIAIGIPLLEQGLEVFDNFPQRAAQDMYKQSVIEQNPAGQ